MRQFFVVAGLLLSNLSFAAEALTIDVHRDANCGCCKAWISHLQDNGFNVVDHVETDMSALKQRLGVPPRLSSCHTGVINGQFVEGHVPAADILKLRQQPDLLGAARRGRTWHAGRLTGYEIRQCT
ncbi:Uncharacterized conserved protein [Pseudomonas anguilliseptica]|uniref:Uncharacterized conserved protein n=1 Tax=Pseudomonas anguilliseptica TaxID=53406 RepID=A0A1H4RH82_PSEAG|nr:Uncharacterized conserved protein [Pseudomonas anguilliseptica]